TYPKHNTLTLHDALPIYGSPTEDPSWKLEPRFRAATINRDSRRLCRSSRSRLHVKNEAPPHRPHRYWNKHPAFGRGRTWNHKGRSEEHTSELQSRVDLVC